MVARAVAQEEDVRQLERDIGVLFAGVSTPVYMPECDDDLGVDGFVFSPPPPPL